MNREEFLSQLERLLYDIPAQEREEALEYYIIMDILMMPEKRKKQR